MTDTQDAAAERPHTLSRLWRYGTRYRRTVLRASVFSILNKLFDLAPPVLIGAAVDIVVRGEGSVFGALGIERPDVQIVVLALVTVVVWGLESAFEYAFATQWRNLAQTIQHDLRLDAYGHIQRLDMGWFEERSTGGLMAVLNDDINQLERFLDNGANSLLQVATTIVAVGVTFFVIAPQVAWVAVLPMPVVIWGSLRFQRRIGPRYAEVREKVSLLNGQLANNLMGIATIKSFTAEAHEVERIRGQSDAYRASNKAAIQLSSAFTPLIRMIIVIGFTGTLIIGGLMALDGALAVGAYSVLVFLTQRLLWPLTRLGQTLDQYQRAMASTDRVLDLLDTPVQLEDGDRPMPRDSVRGEVGFEGVTFAYADRPPLFKGLDLTVEAGQTVAIVGATGSGKSSLVRLLLRFYAPSAGRITLDGVDIRALRLDDLRGAIGLVSQSVYLFHGTVAENIAYGAFGAPQDAIERAARLAEAHEFIQALPEGYDTVIGERGQKLSGGQRQRLSIARAILKDPPVLVLDEATSAVDNETEAAIQRSMARIARDRTTLVIAHRLSTVRDADQIVVLDHGEVCEVGRHDALLKRRDGVYARLWAVQTGERDQDGVQG